ncbi:MAG: 1-(5-phosphoribosyl)-5-[(5-phosphoribosylamino)methylideneamino]imidazole-4-carboxamide isomerase, partial [Spirochaetes bacterium]|nr:1-(5-phosphoribosyl)-5-[(5-phosphoribosylamino)methylideneamino]imidazole-4-carboxamide isomerase [Spirochaetota bacterium]
MIIIPAIDIKDGKCVRLYKGDFEKSKIYSEDPVRIAKEFEEMGASLIHVVDLDGAKRGELANFNTVEKILGSISIDIELGGGIRSMEAIEKIIRAGIKRVILGSRIIEDVSFLDDCSEFIDNIIISADLNREYLSTHGWLKRTDIHYSDFLKD